MPIITLVRHGQAAANWQQDPDPGLSALGQQQALAAAGHLSGQVKPQKLYSSPKLRAQETAAPLASSWQQNIEILDSMTEVPSAGIAMAERGNWLKQVFRETWSQQQAPQQQWREKIIETLLAQQQDCIIFSHFVVINAVIGYARGCDKVFQCQPDYCSTNQFSLAAGKLSLSLLGQQDESLVL